MMFLLTGMPLGTFENSDICFATGAGAGWPTQVPSNPSGLAQFDASGIGPATSTAILANQYDGHGQAVFTNGQPGSWSSPATIGAGTGLYSSYMATDSHGHQHVLFGVQPSVANPTFLPYYTDNTSGTWSTPVAMPGETEAMPLGIKVGLDDTVHMAYYSSSGPSSTKYVKFKNGSFSTPEVVSGSDSPFPLGGGLAIDSAGKAHVGYYISDPGGGGAILIRYNTNSTGTWGTPQTVATTFIIGTGLNLTAGDAGEVHLVFNNLSLGTWHEAVMYRKRSSDGTWSTPAMISASDQAHFYTPPQIALDSAGTIHVMYIARMYKPTGEADYVVRYVKKNSAWSDPVTISGNLNKVSQVVMYLAGAHPHYALTNDGSVYYGYLKDTPAPFVSDTWYLAEGYTGHNNYPGEAFDTYVLVENPTGTDTTVRATYMLPWGKTKTAEYFVPKSSRYTIHLNAVEGVDNQEVSTKIESLQHVGIICERSMYFDYHGKDGGSNSTGATAPAINWYMPEGFTAKNSDVDFDTYVLIENPNAANARLLASFMTEDGHVVQQDLTVGANSRYTIHLNAVPGLADHSVATRIESRNDVPVVCERSSYFNYHGITDGDDSMGVVNTAKTWDIPEGYTGYNNYPGEAFDTYVLIQNPTGTDTDVKATYMLDSGQVLENTYHVAKSSRYTIHLNEVNGLANHSIATRITSQSGVEVICELAMYYRYHGRKGGSSSQAYTHPL